MRAIDSMAGACNVQGWRQQDRWSGRREEEGVLTYSRNHCVVLLSFFPIFVTVIILCASTCAN